MKSLENKNPGDNFGNTPLHWATHDGNLALCMFIINKVEVKNPADNHGWTPLHQAAYRGHLDICRLIINNIENKHPIDNGGKTPMDYAFGICYGRRIYLLKPLLFLMLIPLLCNGIIVGSKKKEIGGYPSKI